MTLLSTAFSLLHLLPSLLTPSWLLWHWLVCVGVCAEGPRGFRGGAGGRLPPLLNFDLLSDGPN